MLGFEYELRDLNTAYACNSKKLIIQAFKYYAYDTFVCICVDKNISLVMFTVK